MGRVQRVLSYGVMGCAVGLPGCVDDFSERPADAGSAKADASSEQPDRVMDDSDPGDASAGDQQLRDAEVSDDALVPTGDGGTGMETTDAVPEDAGDPEATNGDDETTDSDDFVRDSDAGPDGQDASDTAHEAGAEGTAEQVPSAAEAGVVCDPECSGAEPTCLSGQCVACEPGATRCGELGPELCDEAGGWAAQQPCIGATCVDGQCVVPSCGNLADDCGAAANDSCCTSLVVQGGEFDRDADPEHHVALSDYRLDKYEVTVGRFREFLVALAAGWRPEMGVGAYPRAPNSGWNAAWALGTATDIQADLVCLEDEHTWTDEPSVNENRPINCVNWYEAFAFCAWDGGYLPTEAQWEYAAAGGDEQRYYPWSVPPTSTLLSLEYASYYCDDEPISYECFNRVGTKPLGDGRYGQADLGGNVQEWLMDYEGEGYLDCPSGVNCLNQEVSTSRLLRGGSTGAGGSFPVQVSAGPDYLPPATRFVINGFRCARPVAGDFVVDPGEAPGEFTECTPGEMDCNDNVPATCDASGKWALFNECERSCAAGACTQCSGTERSCDGNVPLDCGIDGHWVPGAACAGDTPVCSGGECIAICDQQSNCGPGGNEDCCQTLAVPGGDFNRQNDETLPATISAFSLEKFEVTVGRFREWVDAFPQSIPEAGAGAHPLIADSGWNPDWGVELPSTKQALVQEVMTVGSSDCTTPTVFTYTESPAANEARAVNCLSWYEAFAFCAWSGGRLPTLAELSFAAVGGAEQRVYPWSDPASSTQIDQSFATYDANECPHDTTDLSSCISIVGSKPAGNGRWGHSDLLGNVAEFVMDFTGDLPVPCVDCANVETGSGRALFGGAYDFDSASALENGSVRSASGRSKLGGIRCVHEAL
jgi:formylglycine-generating enzyme